MVSNKNLIGIYNVSTLNETIKNLIINNPNLQEIWVRGEISNLKKHSSGHYYFTLKDHNSQINCVSFSYTNRSLKFDLQNSMMVILFASVDLYTIRGQYQLRVLDMHPDGIGDMFKAFEQLKKKLDLEGIFSPLSKKPIPKFPTRIGVCTSPTGAAIHDIINVLKRRYPVHLIISPCLVQGESAAQSIVDSLEILDMLDMDVIIVGRGGGSLEDLWPFNEEIVARAIFKSNTPIVSAIGHETDFTIADFTADLRAPTPSSAAELVVPDKKELIKYLDALFQRMQYIIQRKFEELNTRLDYASMQFEIKNITQMVEQRYSRIDELLNIIKKDIEYNFRTKSMSLQIISSRMNTVSPLNTLERGYSIVSSQNKVIKKIEDVQVGNLLDVRMTNGIATCIVKEVLYNGKQKKEI